MWLLTQETIAVRKAAHAKACISSYIVGKEKKGNRWAISNCSTNISCLKLMKREVGSSVFQAHEEAILHYIFVLTLIIQKSFL